MKEGCRQRRLRLSLCESLVKMRHGPRAAGSNHRDRHILRNGSRQFQIISRLGAVPVHTGQKNLSRAQLFRFHCPFHGVDPHIHTAAVLVDGKAIPVGTPFRVDCHHHALAAEFIRRFADQIRIHYRRRIDGNLIRALPQNRLKIIYRADAAAHRKGDKHLLGNLSHHLHSRISRVGGSRDIQKNQLVRSRPVISRADLSRIARILKIDEINALDNPAVFHIQTGNNPLCVHRRSISSYRESKILWS